ncbi:hypothetical protein [Streptomyces sp. NPDC102282]|uniref:hypothetical protein n=1 Tax=Streptomyces sp. NPDC102282 TaxID=3366154 RepID=UPI00380C9A53
MSATTLTSRSGWLEDEERKDNQRGYERDETDQVHQLVHRLVADGDTRAESAGRHARRTLAEMAPGYQRQPVLLLTRALSYRSSAAPAPAVNSGQLQCDRCQGWFGFTGWTCSACQQLQGAVLPMRPTPHERDGRTEPPPAPARPHAATPRRYRP